MKTQIGCQWDAKVCLDVSTEVEVEDHLRQPRRRQKIASKLTTHKVYIDVSTTVVDKLRCPHLVTQNINVCQDDYIQSQPVSQRSGGPPPAAQTWIESAAQTWTET